VIRTDADASQMKRRRGSKGAILALVAALSLVADACGHGSEARRTTSASARATRSDAAVFWAAVSPWTAAIEHAHFAVAARMTAAWNDCPLGQRPDAPDELAMAPLYRAMTYSSILASYRWLALHLPPPGRLHDSIFIDASAQIRANVSALSPFDNVHTQLCPTLRRWAQLGFSNPNAVYRALGIQKKLFPRRDREISIKHAAEKLSASGMPPRAVDRFQETIDLSLYP
jgi:hypothetical protein